MTGMPGEQLLQQLKRMADDMAELLSRRTGPHLHDTLGELAEEVRAARSTLVDAQERSLPRFEGLEPEMDRPPTTHDSRESGGQDALREGPAGLLDRIDPAIDAEHGSDPIATPGKQSDLVMRDWRWSSENVVRRWPGATAVRPDNPLVDGHIMIVSDGPGAPVEERMAYAAELAADRDESGAELFPSCNLITSRRGPDSDFGPIHVVPRTPGDELKLPWTAQQAGQPHKPLTEFPCVFDKILAGRLPATVTERWDDGIAIVPLDPVVAGKHQLLIPAVHVRDVAANPAISGAMMGHFADLTAAMPDVDMITSRGEPATQTVGHLHLHAVEREEGDGLELMTS
jgi:histidine triad (HIT) family protein